MQKYCPSQVCLLFLMFGPLVMGHNDLSTFGMDVNQRHNLAQKGDSFFHKPLFNNYLSQLLFDMPDNKPDMQNKEKQSKHENIIRRSLSMEDLFL